MHIRAEYRLGPELKFLSNLDTMHLMERALRRAKLPYALSEGFNPHIKLSMGTVLPVGLWGELEYFDLDLIAGVEPQRFLHDLNQVLPGAIRINDCREIPAGTPSLMNSINAACYVFVFAQPVANELLNDIWESPSLVVKSRGKKKDVAKDLRPGLFKLETDTADSFTLYTWVSIGEPLNIRYDELVELFADRGMPAEAITDVYRQGNYIKKGEQFYSPI